MPDKRTHRGPGPDDGKLFCAEKIETLRSAVADFSMLLSKGYASKSSLKLVGDKFALSQRQRIAILRSTCSDEHLKSRLSRQLDISELAKKQIVIDGYNVLITIEAAMSGGAIFKGRDGCLRDLASVHGTYRKVEETIPAVKLIAKFLDQTGTADAIWLLDSPVSNSGRLKTLIANLATENNWNWQIKLLQNPDKELKKTDSTVASSDSDVIDNCKRWVNLAGEIIKEKLTTSWIIDLE